MNPTVSPIRRRPAANAITMAADPCQRALPSAGRRDQTPLAGRGIYPTPTGLLTAALACLAIAVAAGAALIWSLT